MLKGTMPTNLPVRRSRISQACSTCRDRKVKCDGAGPLCARCHLDGLECSYTLSRRNKRLAALGPQLKLNSQRTPVPRAQYPSMAETSMSHYIDARVPKSDSMIILSDEISNQLFQSYFQCIHPIWPLLYKPLYHGLGHGQMLEALPRPLTSAILSVAVLLHDPAVPAPMGESNSKKSQLLFAKSLHELRQSEEAECSSIFASKPSILHCQVLALLALQQHSIAAFSQAGTLLSAAASMAIEQRLHRKSDSKTYIETQIRSRLWWSIYVLEKMLSCEMSRPALLRAEECDVPWPSLEESDEYEFYVNAARMKQAEEPNFSPVKLRTISAFHMSIRIAMIMESLSTQIYSVAARVRIKENRKTAEETRIRLWTEVQDLQQEMEDSFLRLDTSDHRASLPVAVTNHVFTWSTTILIHRPFIEHWQRSKAINSLSKNAPDSICHIAAENICSIMEIYSELLERLPCDLVFPIFVAANIFLRCWNESGGQDTHSRQRLNHCSRWLVELGKSWKNAEARHQVLSNSLSTNNVTAQTEPARTSPDSGQKEMQTSKSHIIADPFMTLLQENFDLEYTDWIAMLDNGNFGDLV